MDAKDLPQPPPVPEPTFDASGRVLDVSTGKPRMLTDQEVWDQIRTRHRDQWADRDGETLRLRVLRDGLTAFGRVLRQGEVLEVVIGSDDWIQTLDPKTGESFLDLDVGGQIARWKKRFLAPDDFEDADPPSNSSPYQDDRPMRPDGRRMSKGEAKIYQGMHDLHKELYPDRKKDARADAPLPPGRQRPNA